MFGARCTKTAPTSVRRNRSAWKRIGAPIEGRERIVTSASTPPRMTGMMDATRNGARSARNRSCPRRTGAAVAVAVAIPSLQRPRDAHVPGELPVPVHRSHRQLRAERLPALPHEVEFRLPDPLLDRRLQELGHEGEVLLGVEQPDGLLPDDLLRRVSEQPLRPVRELRDRPLQVARDHGRRVLDVLVAEPIRAVYGLHHGLDAPSESPALYPVGG